MFKNLLTFAAIAVVSGLKITVPQRVTRNKSFTVKWTHGAGESLMFDLYMMPQTTFDGIGGDTIPRTTFGKRIGTHNTGETSAVIPANFATPGKYTIVARQSDPQAQGNIHTSQAFEIK